MSKYALHSCVCIYISALLSKIKLCSVTDYVSLIVIILYMNLWLSREICTSGSMGNFGIIYAENKARPCPV